MAVTLLAPPPMPVTVVAGTAAVVEGTYRALNRVRLRTADADAGTVIRPAAATPCFILTPNFPDATPVTHCGADAGSNVLPLIVPAGAWTVNQTIGAPGYAAATQSVSWTGADNQLLTFVARPGTAS